MAKEFNTPNIEELDVVKDHFGKEFNRRAPWMILSVIAGIVMVWVGQSYEELLSKKIQLVFFIPMIVYMSDTIGTETLALFIRELSIRRVNMAHLFFKETLVGLSLGILSGAPMGIFSYLLFRDFKIALTIFITMVANGIIAVLIGMIIPVVFNKYRQDPAVGSNEISTALSDNVSILIYLIVASVVLFNI